MKPEEQLYTYEQSQQLRGQTGSIGHLRGDFGHGNEFYTTWYDHIPSLKTQEFKDDLDMVINTLREKGRLLHDLSSMQNNVWNQPESRFEEGYSRSCGFRADTEHYAFLLRCTPMRGEYNFYCFCYDKQSLDRHISNASRGIRFITPMYQTKFVLPDGERISVTFADGRKESFSCRYIDETHVQIDRNLYHICEYAERLEAVGAVCQPQKTAVKDKEYTR